MNDELRGRINVAYRMGEEQCVENLLQHAKLDSQQQKIIAAKAHELIEIVRKKRLGAGGIDSFLLEFNLSSEEGIALMCIAEALLRVPDKQNIDRLIRDKISTVNWKSHLGHSDSFFVNSTTWALMLTGKMLMPTQPKQYFTRVVKKFLTRSSEPLIRGAVSHAMKIMSRQFVMGQTIEEAIKRAKANEQKGYRYSYDMLGEEAITADDANRYFRSYQHAIKTIGACSQQQTEIQGPDLSIKLSALHPRYEFSQRDRVIQELTPRIFELVRQARAENVAITIDAEESERLDLSLDIFASIFSDPSLGQWEGLGIAVQSYQKRAFFLIDWLAEMAKQHHRRIRLRLIKGAYWDTEIKNCQILGLPDYPVFTRKASTDVSFQACVKKIIAMKDVFYPQFATHNAYAVAFVSQLMADHKDYEFQCLHGMGQSLYDPIVTDKQLAIPCRIYAPVGNYDDLLPYLVRRLLENGANTSFVNRIVDASAPIASLIEDPVAKVESFSQKTHPMIPLPEEIFSTRKNSAGIDLSDNVELEVLNKQLEQMKDKPWRVAPIVSGHEHYSEGVDVHAPRDRQQVIGLVQQSTDKEIEKALQAATKAKMTWDQTPVEQRCACLEHTADLLEKHRAELLALTIFEAGKTIADAITEFREAVDFCRYYAEQARESFAHQVEFKGYTGEQNQLRYHGRGVMLCISPWNFPLAIFVGQIVACLVSGNCVIAKPAAQTPLIAGVVIRLLHAAGIPDQVLHLLPGPGKDVGAKLVADPRINGVVFTGSTQTARHINQALAQRSGPIAPLVAETGGQNVMIVDSSALLEQAAVDIMQSAFGSAGQRCSALRVLFVQEEVADKLINLLKGAMAEIKVGDPYLLSTDIGPVIDQDALRMLEGHAEKMTKSGQLIAQAKLDNVCQSGTFFAPIAIEINQLSQLEKEVFGPILHVIRYRRKGLDQVIDDICNTGYGLTLGIESRINETVEYICQRVPVGNTYVNRNMVGAVVGLQPFGGERLSGTGPKAGGPNYLKQLCHERTLTVNTTAAGGNATLMSLSDE